MLCFAKVSFSFHLIPEQSVVRQVCLLCRDCWMEESTIVGSLDYNYTYLLIVVVCAV